jgi:SAM-dependent methyltransferase
MNTLSHELSAAANTVNYEALSPEQYFEGATQISHRKVWDLYNSLLTRVVNNARLLHSDIRVLDLGAGEGTVTQQMVQLGCRVTAVDISANRLTTLSERCRQHREALTTVCSDVLPYVTTTSDKFDIIIASAFLHHVPDYLSLIRSSLRCLSATGQWFVFHEALRYDSVGSYQRAFSGAAYYSWRVRQGDFIGGCLRKLRRAFGVYRDDSPDDNIDYHVVRNGMDQEAIAELFASEGLEMESGRYFSTQSRTWQNLGERFGIENMFWIVADRARKTRVEVDCQFTPP